MMQPSVFFNYVSPEAARLVLSRKRLRWSSPLLFDDPAEFRRMPRLEPTAEESYQALVDLLIEVACETRSLETDKLSQSASLMLVCSRLVFVAESRFLNCGKLAIRRFQERITTSPRL